MARIAQVGIAIGALGMVITFMGLFPGVTGLEATPGIGVLQMFVVLVGFTFLISGALFYVKFAFYASKPANLGQQIGTRLALTGLVLAALAGLADPLGFGSHGRDFTDDLFLGPLQGIGIIVSYFISCVGVLVYALTGEPGNGSSREDRQDDDHEYYDDGI
jgi:hypothetical protein